MNYKHFSQVFSDENQFLREKLQFFFDKAFEKKDEVQLRSLYTSLRDLDFSAPLDFLSENVNISSLCENITSAFDVFTSHNGKSFIYCGNSTCSVHGNYHFIAKALLNLLSNAYLYGTNSLVTVKTVEYGNFVKVEIRNEGNFPLNNIDGKGLTFVRRVCAELDGCFFIETHHESSVAIMIFKKVDQTSKTDYEQYEFANLLSNRLSPVYVEAFGMEYH
ncbi:MAG: HAMP domain-containing histidine kinase [Clostridia bacterium]|nr:HAMP domain-containing histidine kinase [Clostridia bacterium]